MYFKLACRLPIIEEQLYRTTGQLDKVDEQVRLDYWNNYSVELAEMISSLYPKLTT